jgi:hypothetical protein
MKKFNVTVTEFANRFDNYTETVLDQLVIEAEDILSAIKQLRSIGSDYCYNDQSLVEWINSEDGWDAVVDDEFLMDMIHEERHGLYYVQLAEEIEFEFSEIF